VENIAYIKHHEGSYSDAEVRANMNDNVGAHTVPPVVQVRGFTPDIL